MVTKYGIYIENLFSIRCINFGFVNFFPEKLQSLQADNNQSNLELFNNNIHVLKNHTATWISTNSLSIIVNNGLSLISNLMTVWGFMETREKKQRDSDVVPTTHELLEEWKSNMTNLTSKMDEMKVSLKELTCRLDAIHATKDRSISRECLKFIQQPPRLTKDNALMAKTKATHSRQNIPANRRDHLSNNLWWLRVIKKWVLYSLYGILWQFMISLYDNSWSV